MRDPNRIEPFLDKLQELWQRYPDYRFGQLIMNLVRDPQNPLVFQDPWSWEEEEWEALISEYNEEELTDEEILRRARAMIDELRKE